RIGSLQGFALRRQRWVRLIGRYQGLAQRVRAGRPGHQRSDQRRGNEIAKPGAPLESESLRATEARQRRNPRIPDRKSTERTARLAADDEARDPAVRDRGAETATVGQLVDDRVRN